MMYEIKALNWTQNSEGTSFAEPYGMMWMYYITPLDSGIFELTLINEYGETNPQLWMTYDSLDKAKQSALKHYQDTLSQLLTKVNSKVEN